MNKRRWTSLLKGLRIENDMGKLTPVDRSAFDAFRRESGVALPSSYRAFCSVFGAGEIAREFLIAVPGFQGRSEVYSLRRLQEMSHQDLEYDEYSPDPNQHARGLFFATDVLGSKYFFDPKDVTDARNYEYGVYTLRRDWVVRRIADDFWQFLTDLCLGERHNDLIENDEPPEQLFRPVSK
jgi:hypothetical protein